MDEIATDEIAGDEIAVMAKPIILIPARMASGRLPGKPLAEIGGEAMIVHMARRAEAAGIAPVVVAAGDNVIVEHVEKAGFRAVLTASDLASGSDRCAAALAQIERGAAYDVIINLQGDMPNIAAAAISACYEALIESGGAGGAGADCATLVHLCDAAGRENPDQVKAVLAHHAAGRYPKAIYFSRAAVPSGEGDIWGHVGIYAWRRESLLKFSGLAPSPLEKRERLEQLRAIENDMVIIAAKIDTPPLSVDSEADLARAREIMA